MHGTFLELPSSRAVPTTNSIDQAIYDVVYRAVTDALRDAAEPPAAPAAPSSGLTRLTVPEAARKAGRAPDTIRIALQTGELHGVQRVKGGRWAIKPEDLEAWMDGSAATASP